MTPLISIDPKGRFHTRQDSGLMSIDRALEGIHLKYPETLTGVAEQMWIKRLRNHFDGADIPEEVKAAIEEAVKAAEAPPPIMPPTPQESIAWLGGMDHIVCKHDLEVCGAYFKAGRGYAVEFAEAPKYRHFTRDKMHITEDGIEVKPHAIRVDSKDTVVKVTDFSGRTIYFVPEPVSEFAPNYHIPEARMFDHFEVPDVPTVKEVYPERYQANVDALQMIEALHGFEYYPGQLEYAARVGCVNGCIVSAETGCGKTLIAISLLYLSEARRTLVVAPKGTVKSGEDEYDYDPAQWVAEINKFAPELPVYPLFSEEDYLEVVRDDGMLPHGVFISYPNALFTNGAVEYMPAKPDTKEDMVRATYGLDYPEDEWVTENVGLTKSGIHCLAVPSMASRIGNAWDCVILDEAHLICNPGSNVSKCVHRMHAPYRYALTATPMPNFAYNSFSLLGWVAVDHWKADQNRNTRFPYKCYEFNKFKKEYTAKEHDETENQMREAIGKRPKAAKDSPILSNYTKLLRYLKPNLAYISKKKCNPNLVRCNLNDLRVPMGAQQYEAYRHVLDLRNIPATSPLAMMAQQMQWLRGVCAAPADCEYTGTMSNFNPKLRATLDKMFEILGKGEQVIHITARIAQNDEIAKRLDQCGIEYARIDSTTPAHSYQANLFKNKRAPVLLMGIKCAQAYSFEQCRNLIIGSLDWGWGSYCQAIGRVYRVNSPLEVNIWTILVESSIEHLTFEKLAQKRDTSTICLEGETITEDTYTLLAPNDILVRHLVDFPAKDIDRVDELLLEATWDKSLQPEAIAQ